MGVVVLLGCWTAGKSSTVRRLEQKYPGKFRAIDTDSCVAESFAGWIYNIYLALVDGANVNPAADYIEWRERCLLTKLLDVREPCLIAAGPMVPTREPIWSAFINHIKPTCIYLSLSPEEVYDGLSLRRLRQCKNGLDLVQNFGSWDKDLCTQFDPTTGLWEVLNRDDSLACIEAQMSSLTTRYKRVIPGHRTYSASRLKWDRELQDSIDEVLAYHLGIENEPVVGDYLGLHAVAS